MANGDIVNNAVVANGQTLQQTRTPYSTAVSVQIERELGTVRRRLVDEAMIGGEMMYYGWGAGKDHIEGPSIHLAMAAARCWGNCAVFPEPVQETNDAWIFTSSFVDLETGFTLQRQFRQSKSSVVHGKHDQERKSDIRFQIGQSKASRNVVVNALPKSIIREAMEAAKSGVRERLEKWIENKGEGGMAIAQDSAIATLLKAGVDEERVLLKFSRPTRGALSLDDLVVLKGDIVAIQEGNDRAEDLYPPPATEASQNGVMEHLDDEKAPFPEPEEKKMPPVGEPAPKSSKRKSKAKTEAEQPTTPPEPEKDAQESLGDLKETSQPEPEWIWGDIEPATYIKSVCDGLEGLQAQYAAQELKARYNRLADDPLALAKYVPDWETIEKQDGKATVRVVSDIRGWYFAKADAEGFPQEVD